MSTRIRVTFCAFVVLMLVLAACGSSGGSKSSKSSPSTASSDTSGDSSSSSGGNKIDACGLITDAEAATILGEAVDKKTPTTGGGTATTCEWHTAGEFSITIEVGDDGTAPGDKLKVDPIMGDPKPAPALGDKGALLPGGTVYFAAGDRLNNVQVVSKTAGGADDQGAIDLAVKIAPAIASGS